MLDFKSGEVTKYFSRLKDFHSALNASHQSFENLNTGFDMLDQNKYTDAIIEFEEAIKLLDQKEQNQSGAFIIKALSQVINNNADLALEYVLNEMIINPENEYAYELHDIILEKLDSANEKILSNENNNFLNIAGSNLSEKAINSKYTYDVTILIPVYNNIDLTFQCLEALYLNSGTKYKYEVLVINNGSIDETDVLLNDFAAKYENFNFINNDYNKGFSRACNQGIQNRKGRNLVLLNNDTIPQPDWLDCLMEEADSDKSVGALGAFMLYPTIDLIQHLWIAIGSEDGTNLLPYHPYQYQSYEIIKNTFNESFEVSAISGTCMLLTEQAIETVGLFDELYLNGCEDIDYCFKLKEAGFKIKTCPNVNLYHYESMTNSRHDWDSANWQRLNRLWSNKIKPDDTIESTKRNISQINKLRESLNDNLEENYRNTETLINQNHSENFIQYDFSIIIPIHNNLVYTKQCISSIFANSNNILFEIIIINNASNEGTTDYLNSIKSDRIKVITNFENISYAKANNQGAKIASGKNIVFLNNDISVCKGWLHHLMEEFELDQTLGVQGAKLLYHNSLIQHAGIVYCSEEDGNDSHINIYQDHHFTNAEVNKKREFQFVSGALFAIRNDVFTLAEGFDENYNFGYEDLDLCLKVKQLEYKVIYNPLCEAFHFNEITKKSLGIERFEINSKNENNSNFKNKIYFQNKWANVLRYDCDEYFESDGFYGLSQNIEIKRQFEQKITDILTFVSNLIKIGDLANAVKISKILINSDRIDFLGNASIIYKVPNSKLEEAEMLIQTIKYPIHSINKSKPLKRILMTMYGWNEKGGGTTFPRSVAVEMVKLGFQVCVFYAAGKHSEINSPYYLEKKLEDGVKLYGIFNRPTNFLDDLNPDREVNNYFCNTLFNQALNEFKPDIIHYHNFLGLSFGIAFEPAKRGIPSFFTPHNYHFIDPKLYMINEDLKKWKNTNFFENSPLPKEHPELVQAYQNRRLKALETLNLNINYILPVSSGQKAIFEEFGGNSEKLYVINQVPNGLNYPNNIEKSKTSKLRIGYIGGVMPQKGIHFLLEAGKELEHNSVEINIYGFTLEKYKSYLLNIDSKQTVNYKGEYSQNQLIEIGSNNDLLVLPSIWEDCAPLTIVEGLSVGLPIIAPNIGGFKDFIKSGFNGLIYNWDSSKGLAECINTLNKDRKLLNALSQNCHLPYVFNDYLNHLVNIYQLSLRGENFERKNIELKFINYLNEFNSTNIEKKVEQGMKYQEEDNTEIDLGAMNRLKLDNDLSFGFSNKSAKGKLPSVLPTPLKLNLGCGKDIRDGFLNIDLFSNEPSVIRMDIRNLEIGDNTVDFILASDILEHFSHREVDLVLKEWARVLKPGGSLEIRCPSLKLQLQAYMRGDWNADIASYMIFGGQTNPGDYHCIAFDETSIRNHLGLAGLEVFDYLEHDFPQEEGFINLNMTVMAKKMSLESNYDGNEWQNTEIRQEPDNSTLFGQGNEDLDVGDFLNNGNNEMQPHNQINFNMNIDPQKGVLNFDPKINIVWEGSQLVYHSLALINREHCYNIIKSGVANLTIIPYENDQFSPDGNEKYELITSNDIRFKPEQADEINKLPYVRIRHQWPPKDEVPLGSKWIIMQPWEFTQLRKDFVELFNEVDEVWTPSNFCRNNFVASGVEFNKVQVIPNGINPKLFTPIGNKYQLKTSKKIKLLFVGGTISRKGIDILLTSYLSSFNKNDNICLVIKDLGGDSFYKGQTAQQMIRQSQQTSNAPEIEYIDDKLNEEEIASLYRACDVFVSPYRGEGFSLPTLEAMASGLPVIVTKGGATDDFVDEEIGWQIPAERVSIGNMIDGKPLSGEAFLLEPSEDGLSNILKDIYSNHSSLQTIGLLGSYRARKDWTWNKASLKALTRLDYLYGTEMASKAQEILVDEEDSILLLSMAEKLFNEQNIEEAIELYIKAIEMGIDDSEYNLYAHHSLIMIALDLENFDWAEGLLDECERIDHQNPDTKYLKAKYAALMGNLTESLEIQTELMENWKTYKYDCNLGITLDHLLCYSGDILFAMKDYENAIKIYDASLQINKENFESCYGIAQSNIELGNIDFAIEYLEKTIQLAPFFEEAQDKLMELVKNK